MTIDAFDWLHRTVANQPDNSTDPAYVGLHPVAAQDPAAGLPRPFNYEASSPTSTSTCWSTTTTPTRVNWINESLSDFAQTLSGTSTQPSAVGP